jgi:hypothetical protein
MYIFHHLGIGDHIICNGMVRYFTQIYQSENIRLFCHDHYKENIKYMYRDEERIIVLPIKNENRIHHFLSKTTDKSIKIGFYDLAAYEHGYKTQHSTKTFDEAFYDLAQLNFKIRFDNFFVERNADKEEEALDYLNPNREEYIYVHDASERGFVIDPLKHRSDLKIIRNDFKYNIFQFRKVLENATEIHTMQTGMLDFCNSVPLEKPKIFVHKYVRNYDDFILAKGINSVNLIS